MNNDCLPRKEFLENCSPSGMSADGSKCSSVKYVIAKLGEKMYLLNICVMCILSSYNIYLLKSS